MQFDRRQFGVGLIAAATLPGAAPAMLASAAMQGDLALLGNAYRTLHPGLERYETLAQFEARLAALSASCGRALSLGDFYVRLSRFLSGVRCGHSYANFYNQTKAVQAALFDGATRFPFLFRWLGNDMVVTADPTVTGIAPGSIVEAIDGRPARQVLQALLPLVRADGHNDDKRRALLSVQADDELETFDVFYPLVFGRASSYELAVCAPDDARRRVNVAAIDLAARRAQRAARPAGDAPPWRFERRGATAVLTMPGWALYDSKWDWRAWLEARLDDVGDAGLVIDLRGNEGGLDCGDPIVARLLGRALARPPERRLVRYARVPNGLRPVLRTWDKHFYDWGARATRIDARVFALAPARDDDAADGIVPTGKRLRGKVAVLVGPANSSATFNFAQIVQRERLAVLVGEPTGGNRRGINGGGFFFVDLPGTGVEVDLPLIATFPATPQPDAGLTPDIHVAFTAAAIAAGRDEAMARALAAVT